MAGFLELHDLSQSMSGKSVTINVEAIDIISTVNSPRRGGESVVIRLRSGHQIYVTETYDEVHELLYNLLDRDQ